MSSFPGKLYIDGEWCNAVSNLTLPVINPSNETVLANVAAGDARDVDRAVVAANAALPAWRHLSGRERASYLRAIAHSVDESSESLELLQSKNVGKPLAESRMDIADVSATFRYYAELAEQLDARQAASVSIPYDTIQANLHYQPCGVVGLIVPWNFPMVSTAWKLAPALAAGCTVVLKPSEFTPLPELALTAIIARVGLPSGVLNVVNGSGADVGAALVAHPGISKISFTGSTGIGQQVMKSAADTVKGISLELGGKSSILVFADADLDLAVELVTGGIFFNAGQMCSATSRLLVEKTIADDFLKRIKSAAEKIVVGDPLSDGTQMGPLVNSKQHIRVRQYIAGGIADGATLVTGGTIPNAGNPGYFVAPTIFSDVSGDSAIWREEIFGPVLCVRSFSTEHEAVSMANDTEYGLVATVVGRDSERNARVAAAIDAGTVWINSPQLIFPQTAWGGMKKSGIGRELGPWGLAAFQEIKHIVAATDNRLSD